jgi:hypothetical protein
VTFTVTITNTGSTALPADGSTVTVALPAGLTAGGAVTFTLGALAPGQSVHFTVSATATATGSQTVTATVTSPDASPATVSGSTTVNVQPRRGKKNLLSGGARASALLDLLGIKR